MNEQQASSPRQRLRELLALPERQRSDAQWDEINELEITLSAANRVDSREPGGRRNNPAAPNDPPKPGGAAPGKKSFRKFGKRPPKEKVP